MTLKVWSPLDTLATTDLNANFGFVIKPGDDGSAIRATPTGATQARNLASLLGDTPSVANFGAVGDGATLNDAAVAAQFAATTFVYVPHGFFALSQAALVKYQEFMFGPGFIGIAGMPFVPAGDVLHNNITLPVPGLFPDLASACSYLRARFISANVGATIQIADGTYAWSNVEPRIPNGIQVSIIGNATHPGNVVINVANLNNSDFLIVKDGYRIGYVNGMTVNGTAGWQSAGVWATGSYGSGFLVTGSGSWLSLGGNVVINKMYYGVLCDHGAFVTSQPGLTVAISGDCCVLIRFRASCSMPGVIVSGANHTDPVDGDVLGFGVMFEAGATGDITGSQASGCKVAGFGSQSRGGAWMHSCTSSSNIGCGFYTREGGWLEGNGSTASTNGNDGFRNEAATMSTPGAVSAGNSGDGFSSYYDGKTLLGTVSTTGNAGYGIASYADGKTYGASAATNTGNTKGTIFPVTAPADSAATRA